MLLPAKTPVSTRVRCLSRVCVVEPDANVFESSAVVYAASGRTWTQGRYRGRELLCHGSIIRGKWSFMAVGLILNCIPTGCPESLDLPSVIYLSQGRLVRRGELANEINHDARNPCLEVVQSRFRRDPRYRRCQRDRPTKLPLRGRYGSVQRFIIRARMLSSMIDQYSAEARRAPHATGNVYPARNIADSYRDISRAEASSQGRNHVLHDHLKGKPRCQQ